MTLSERYGKARWKLAQYLEGKWWQRYLKNKSPEAYLADKRRYWQSLLDDLNWETVKGRQVLDAGCGPAGIFIHLRSVEQVVALDPLLDTYAGTLDIFDQGNYPEVSFYQQPLEQRLPEDLKFDAIYCFNAINHVADWSTALDQLTAYAHPGTRMILSSDVHRHAWLLPIFKALPGDALHPQQHGPEAYRTALRQRGWIIDSEMVLREEAIFNYTAWTLTFQG
ncbi:bifunctional 2-polyprenyl-6-hydroxyphenol methylase/3-demethylubiquinol 3-O-methyltransferase UbiG [Lewinella sp. 4G2]|uniref:class I SAM-dependent methyltransferase n=1 Tax=Lewinella sp. 4G2 TaxID=1803372 RepID=UPI0007B478FD|nr:methyltransferase domain-containing protein [Lewinella sp. 4G2]OAV45400.1 hypothetical protein A3850_013255 [Lewinella sp. 4G2]